MFFAITSCNSKDNKSSEYKLSEKYTLVKVSRYSIVITDEYSSIVIPDYISELNYNANYIFVKQLGMKNKYPDSNINNYKIPDESKVFYWIIDLTSSNVSGQFNLTEYNKFLKEENIRNLKLKDVKDYIN